MAGINKAIIVGRAGKDVELRYTPSGTAVASVSVATSESWTDKNTGQKQEKTEWHNLVMFGKLAEIAGQYLEKGTLAYFEGKIRTEKYQDQQGIERYSTKIYADTMQLLDNPNKEQQPQNANQASYQQPSQQSAPRQYDDFDDDPIPF